MSYPAEKNKKYLADRYRLQREEFIAFLGGKCEICGTTDHLEIDHIDWAKKSFNVGRLWPAERLPEVYEELRKCRLLCKQHHIEKTRADQLEISALQPGFTHGTVYAWMKKKCSCTPCSSSKRIWHDARNARRRLARTK